MATAGAATRGGSGARRFPRLYRGAGAARGAAGAGASVEEEAGAAEALAGNGDRDAVAAKKQPAEERSPTDGRPRRNRTPRKLYTDESSARAPANGTKGGPSPRGKKARAQGPNDPYKGEVYWAKFSHHPYWPSVKCTAHDIAELDPDQPGGAAWLEKQKAKLGKAPSTAVVFLGSNDRAVVKNSEILDYSANFDRFTRKKYGKHFDLGLEKADEIVLRKLNDAKPAGCNACDEDVVVKTTGAIKANSLSAMVCERCLVMVHARCAEKEGVLITGFDNELPPAWFCGSCAENAPLTFKMRKDQEEKERRKLGRGGKRRAGDGAGGSSGGATSEGPKKRRKSGDAGITADNAALSGPSSRHFRASTPPIDVANWKRPNDNPRARSKDNSDDYCFVCGDGGTLLICDFPNCHRSYHQYCLSGGDLVSPEADAEMPYFCSWHCCAECGETEGGTLEGEDGKPRRALHAAPAFATLRTPTAYLEGEDEPLESVGTPTASGAHSGAFIRCATCPTALCAKHRTAPRPVFDGKAVVVPHAIHRHPKRGYFKCEQCVGTVVRGQTRPPLPEVGFAKALHKGWSRIVNGHEHLCKLFLCKISKQDLPDGARDTWDKLEAGGVTNLLHARNKVWALRYRSVDEFKHDCKLVARLAEAVFGGSSTVVTETAQSLPIMLEHALRAFTGDHTRAAPLNSAAQVRLRWDHPESAFSSGCLFPSVVMKGSLSTADVTTVAMAKSSLEWERAITNTSFKTGQSLPQPHALPAREEARGIAAALLSAAQSVGGFDSHLPPSRQSLDEMLEQQSMLLRSALRSTAVLREGVRKSFDTFCAGPEDLSNGNGAVVTMGEMRMAAEYSMANRALRAKNEQLKTMIKLEREARREAEARLAQLEKSLDQAQ